MTAETLRALRSKSTPDHSPGAIGIFGGAPYERTKIMNTRFVRGLAVVAVVCAWSVAHAQQPRYQRKTPKIKVEVKQTEATQGLKPKAETKKETAPEITADEFLNVQGQVKNIRAAQIEALKELIRDTDKA